MKAPRDYSGADLVKALERLDYRVTRQSGSHLRLTTSQAGEHHVTIPAHAPLKIGTLHAILRDVADHHGLPVAELVRMLFGK